MTANLLSRAAAEEFLIWEAHLLDQRCFSDWLDLFTDDGIYWVPSAEEDDPAVDTSIIYDDAATRQMRVRRFDSDSNWSQVPKSRTQHCVSNVWTEELHDGGVVVHSYQVIHEFRVEQIQTFPVRCRHELHQVEGTWKIASRKVLLLNSECYLSNMSFPI